MNKNKSDRTAAVKPETYDPVASGLPERRKTARRRTNGVKHYHHRYRGLIYGLGAVSGVLFLLLLFTAIQLSLYAKEINDQTMILNSQERELDQLRPRIQQLEKDLSELVQGRLPGLYPLEFDKVISVKKQYVRNIIFTLIGKETDRSYEYKVSVKNEHLTAVHPIIRVLFFDQLGIQVASSVIGLDEEGVPTLDVLERGEVRSYTKEIDLPEGKKAKYFIVETDVPEYQKIAK